MRVKHSVLIIFAMALIAPTFSHSQFGGGRNKGDFKGGGGGPPTFGGGFTPPSPDVMFDNMAKGKDVLNRSDLDERGQRMFDRMAENAGVKDGRMTREQFKTATEKFASGGGMRMQFGGGGASPMGGGSGGSTANNDDRRAEAFFNMSDRNKDGMLSFEELSERLRPLREKYDANNDGFIDQTEYKKYMTEQFSTPEKPKEEKKDDNSNPSDPNRKPDGPMPNFNTIPTPEEKEEERRPTLIRVGKLPKEIPSWFERLDTDVDGQVGFYEWRRDGRDLSSFEELDFNADGLITPEEVMKSVRTADDEKKKLASKSDSNSSRGGRDSASSGGGSSDWASRWGGGGGNSSSQTGGGGPPAFGGRFGGGGGPPAFGGRFGGGGGTPPATGGGGTPPATGGGGPPAFGGRFGGGGGGPPAFGGGPPAFGGGGPPTFGGGGPPAFGGGKNNSGDKSNDKQNRTPNEEQPRKDRKR